MICVNLTNIDQIIMEKWVLSIINSQNVLMYQTHPVQCVK